MRLRPGDVCELFDGCGQAARVRLVAVEGASSMRWRWRSCWSRWRRWRMWCWRRRCRRGLTWIWWCRRRWSWGVSRGAADFRAHDCALDGREAQAEVPEVAAHGAGGLQAVRGESLAGGGGAAALCVVYSPRGFAGAALAVRAGAAGAPAARVAGAGARAGSVGVHAADWPEGDFSPAEYEAGASAGFAPVSLGPIVLRVETAVFMAVAAARYALIAEGFAARRVCVRLLGGGFVLPVAE